MKMAPTTTSLEHRILVSNVPNSFIQFVVVVVVVVVAAVVVVVAAAAAATVVFTSLGPPSSF